ncbi:hypothetical protein chiPu_0031448, partial [Chiloscyllium punctatum]|nr:hypothetical protein [Chiloscyllium punctatum]
MRRVDRRRRGLQLPASPAATQARCGTPRRPGSAAGGGEGKGQAGIGNPGETDFRPGESEFRP